MLYSDEHDRVSLCLAQFLFHIANRIAEIRHAISQQIFEFIGGNHDHPYIDMAVLKAVADVDNVTRQQVAPSRDLNFYTNPRDNSLIVSKSLDPIDIPGL